MGGGARRGWSGFRRQRPVGRRVVLAVAVYPPSGDHLFQFAAALSDNTVPASVQKLQTLVNAPTARSRQAVCRCPLIRLPDAAIGVPLPRAAAQAARGALRGPCCVRLSAWWSLPVACCEVADTRQCAAGALTWPAHAATDSTIDKQPTPTRDRAPRKRCRPTGSVLAAARVAHLRCRGLQLWHHGSAHRGVNGNTSRAIVSLPSDVMVCETRCDGPPHVSQK